MRSMRGDEVETLAIELAVREGWNPGLHDAANFVAADLGFLLAECDGQLVGCIGAVSYGEPRANGHRAAGIGRPRALRNDDRRVFPAPRVAFRAAGSPDPMPPAWPWQAQGRLDAGVRGAA